jgi:hypothetical protein
MSKIARVDAEAMNSLYAAELAKVGMKIAADALTDDKGAPKDPQAFTDHEEYVANLKSAMEDDKKVEGTTDPNDKILD